MNSFQSLSVEQSKSGVAAVIYFPQGGEYAARFRTSDDLMNALTDAGIVIVRDRRLVRGQLRAFHDVRATIHATPEQLSKAGFTREFKIAG